MSLQYGFPWEGRRAYIEDLQPLPDMPPTDYPAEANPKCAGCELVAVCLGGMRRTDNEARMAGAMAEEIKYTAPDRIVPTGTALDGVLAVLTDAGRLQDDTGAAKQARVDELHGKAVAARV